MDSRPGTSAGLRKQAQGDLPRQVSQSQSTEAFAVLLAAAAAKALSADAAALWLLDEAGNSLVFTAGHGLALTPPENSLIPLSASSLQGDALAGSSASVEDASSDSRGAELPPGLTAALCVPLGGGEGSLGTLCVYAARSRRFTSAEVEHLQVLAGAGVTFFETARRSAELERAEAERSRLAQVTTHQLRSPITIAQSLLRNLVKGYAGPITDQQRDVLARIAGQLEFLSHLVNDFLDLAASKAPALAGQERPVAINLSVARVVLVLQPRAEEKEIALALRPCREELLVWASEEGLDHIFHNLVENAVKYTPPGGQVTVSLARSSEGSRPDCAGEAQVTVTDTGIGIPEEAQARLFEEFYRAQNARAFNAVGTGLGLAIVKELVDRYRGRITVQSAGGEGATFTVTIPLYQATT
jgi:signal transduction histidine kinase